MFHLSSMDIHLKNGHVLCAYCRKPTGEATYSELDLNQFLGARKGKQGATPALILDQISTAIERHPYKTLPPTKGTKLTRVRATAGEFRWGSSNFSADTSDVNLQLEGETNEPILRARMSGEGGTKHESRVNLGDCIKNENGHLQFMECF